MIKSFFLYTSYTLVTLAIVVVSFVNLAPQFGSNPTSEQIKYYGTFPNYRDGGFESLEKTPMMTGEVSTWEFFKNDTNRKPKSEIIPKNINYSQFSKINEKDYKIAWLGHSAFIINLSGKIILLDPMLGSHAAPVPIPSLKRYNEILPINPDSLNNIDVVVISHDHYDHLDHSTIKRIKDNVNIFVVPHGVGNHLRKWEVKEENIIELNWNESFEKDNIEFTCLPARHFSGRGPLNRNSTLWCSWAIKSPFVKIYFSGDSGYGKHFKKIGDEHGPFNISLLDCGQYNKAWKYSHMVPSEAVLAAKDLGAEFFMPIHWGGFTLAMHPWDEPVEESIKFADRVGLSYLTPEIGEIVSKNKLNRRFTPWWERY
jgi:L-ascorbate metabolism protein UlaG (beta-lactamase superfamily)